MNMNYTCLLDLCIKAKKSGIDAFFYYSPHVDEVNISIFNKGFENEKSPNLREDIDMKSHTANEALERIYNYLDDLIKEKSPQVREHPESS